ncbi:hypothetical protein [Flagellimonas ruestringensis]|uniref:hypothetical protein n=1 Tax=Flagellimonas ruestringensis TaxID=111501 RepID=UPI0002DACBC6|nr:hypothetical protein [Allomuricauda ruestringensis]
MKPLYVHLATLKEANEITTNKKYRIGRYRRQNTKSIFHIDSSKSKVLVGRSWEVLYMKISPTRNNNIKLIKARANCM